MRSLAGLVEGDRLELQLSRLLDLLDLECGWPLEEAVFLFLVVQVALDRGQSPTVEDCPFHFALPSLVLGDKLVEELVRVDVLVLVLLRLLLVLLIWAPAIAALIPAASVRLHWGELALLEGIVLRTRDLLTVRVGVLVAVYAVQNADFHNLFELLQDLVARLVERGHLLLEEVCVVVLELVEAIRFLDTLLIPPLGDELGYVLGQGLALALDSLQVLTVPTENLFELIECLIFL